MKQARLETSNKVRKGFIWVASIYITFMVTYLVLRWLAGDSFWRISLFNSFALWTFLPLPVLVLLALKIHARKILWGLLPVLVIALVWFIPYFVPKTHAAPSGTSLRVLTLNVWGNNPDLPHVEQWVRSSGADVVLLQEVAPDYAKDRLPDLLDIYPYQSAQPDDTRYGGNITLSRYPMLSAEYIDLHVPDEPAPERILLDVDGERVAVYNIHLAWPAGDLHLRPPMHNFYVGVAFSFDDTKRNQQIAHLLDYLKNESYPYIVGGDFNTSDFSATYGQLAAQMHDSFKEGGFGLGGSWPVARARGLPSFIPPLLRIDYIWHSDGLRTVDSWQGPPVGSDHLPLFATLELVK